MRLIFRDDLDWYGPNWKPVQLTKKQQKRNDEFLKNAGNSIGRHLDDIIIKGLKNAQ